MSRFRFAALLTLALLFAMLGGWAARRASRYERLLRGQPTTAARWEQQIQQARQQRDATLRQIETARQQTTPALPTAIDATRASDPTQAAEIEQWVRRTKRLKQAFELEPGETIPELALLDNRDWLRAARRVNLDTEDGLERALAIIRNQARSRVVQWLRNSLEAFVRENQGRLPADAAELRPFLPALEAAIFAHYEMVRSGTLSDAPPGPLLKSKSRVNGTYDDRVTIDRRTDGSLTFTSRSDRDPDEPADDGSLHAQVEHDLRIAVRAFAAKNRGALPKTPAELIPYFDPPLGPALTEMLRRPMTPEQEEHFPEEIAQLARGPRLPR